MTRAFVMAVKAADSKVAVKSNQQPLAASLTFVSEHQMAEKLNCCEKVVTFRGGAVAELSMALLKNK